MTVSDTTSFIDVPGRCDDGSEENIASLFVAEKAVLQGIGYLELISNVELRVTFKKEEDSHEYTFLQA